MPDFAIHRRSEVVLGIERRAVEVRRAHSRPDVVDDGGLGVKVVVEQGRGFTSGRRCVAEGRKHAEVRLNGVLSVLGRQASTVRASSRRCQRR